MRHSTLKLLGLSLAALLVCIGAGAAESSDKEVVTLHLMGDSTMADKDISGLNPERGWGMVFENFFDSSVKVKNYARNGRSTKSFIDEGLWDEVKANMKSGDYLFIEFGHNDQKKDKEKVYASAWGAYQDNLRMFISTARSMGVTPVLLTSVARRHFKDGVLDETTLGDYPQACREVARETGTVLIDMEKATIDWLRKAGDEASREYFMWVEPGVCPAIPQGRQDNTHSNARGARRNCDIVCDSIKVKIPALASHLVRYDYVVDQSGRGDFLTVQQAIDAVPDYLDKVCKTILIKEGTYRERIIIPASKCNLRIVGQGADKTILVYDNCARKLWPDTSHEIGTFGSATLFVDASKVTFEDLSVVNDSGPQSEAGQAVAVMTTGDCIFFHRCSLVGNQDTLFTNGRYTQNGTTCRSYYLDCHIEGTTDFIFGSGTVLFENCTIHSKRNSYITAASTSQGEKFGYVFKNCRLTADPGIDKVYLGRPWRDYARVVYLECEMGGHITAEGWHNWSRPEREKTAYYAEYKCSGKGAKTSGRVSWAHKLSASQAREYTLENIFRTGSDTWNPLETK